MRKIATRWWLGILLGWAGCATTRVESLVILQSYERATFYDKVRGERVADREVLVAALTPLLTRATWVEGGVITKGSIWLEYPNRRTVRIALGFECFFVEGVPGHFEIRPEDRAAFRAAVMALRASANTP